VLQGGISGHLLPVRGEKSRRNLRDRHIVINKSANSHQRDAIALQMNKNL
jgi:hypothetical protein